VTFPVGSGENASGRACGEPAVDNVRSRFDGDRLGKAIVMSSARTIPPVAPEMPSGELVLPPPPVLDRTDSGGLLTTALPMLGSVGAVALIVTMGGHGVRGYLAAGLCLVASLGFVAVQLDRQRRHRRQRIGDQRGDYLHHLATVRSRIRAAAGQQRAALCWHHPDPTALPALAAEGSRLGERGPGDERFLQVRYGVRTAPLALDLVLPDDASGRADPVATAALRQLVAVHRRQPDLPATLDLRAHRRVTVTGEEEPTRAVARALLCAATALHPPDRLAVAVLTTPERLRHWDWVKWLPHAASPTVRDAVGPRRLVTTSATDLAVLLPDDLRPHLLLVLDGVAPPGHDEARPEERTTTVQLGGRHGPDDLMLDAQGAGTDRLEPAVAEAYARRMASWHAGRTPGSGTDRPRDLMTLLGLGDVRALDPSRSWRPRPARERLRVPIGLDEAGEPVHLDLKESAQQGMGPHGLVVGATGSGKSELLRTLVLGLALTHPPDALNLVLIDFKGGATFAGMAALPHVSAVITNLADDLALVTRMEDALAGELVRRQEVLRSAGNLTSITEYEQARRLDATLPPLPVLLVVVDEFSELIAAKPELTELFVSIGRLGRGLGLHLLLASQRLDEGRLRGLESHLSYRIGLRTFSAHESRAVLGVPDAYELPAVPGIGYLKAGPEELMRFRAVSVSGAAPGDEISGGTSAGTVRAGWPAALGMLPFSITPIDVPDLSHADTPMGGVEGQVPEGSVLELAVARLAGHGPPAHRVWLPPLDVPATLDRLLVEHGADGARLVVPIGTVDRPREQRRDVLALDLRGAAGHVAVVGGPRSGRSTLLRTLVASLALTCTPREARLYLLDLGGGSLEALRALQHVSGVAGRDEPEVVRRIVAEVGTLLERRTAWFREHGVDSIDDYRARRPDGTRGGDVFLVVDGWAGLRAEHEELEAELQRLAQHGLTYGVHLVTSATRWADYRPALRDLFGTRLELRLGEPGDSEIDRRTAALVPADRPGRGLVPSGLHFLTALPRIDGDPRTATLAAGVTHLVERVRTAWPGPPAPRLRLLPERVDLADLRRDAGVSPAVPGSRLLLGVDERDLRPVTLDPDHDPHLLVLGDGGSGRSSLLRTYAAEVMRTRTPQQAQLVVVDYRRTLLGELPDAYVLSHLASAAQAGPALQELAGYLAGRLPGPDVTPTQLRARNWWQGAEVFVLVDDYDLVATPQGSPLHALQPLLAQARDVGLHLVLARRAGGAARALHEPVVQTLRDLAAPGLLLSGDPTEGPLLGTTRAVRAVPGRARLVTRDRGTEVVQLAWSEPTTSALYE